MIFQGDFLVGPQNLNSEAAGHDDESARFSCEGELFCKSITTEQGIAHGNTEDLSPMDLPQLPAMNSCTEY